MTTTERNGIGKTADVLVTDGRHAGVLAAVRALRAAGYRPWVAVSERGARAAWSRAAVGSVRTPEPGVDPDGFAGTLADAARRLGLSAVLPGTERALVSLAERRSAFPASVALGTCPPEVVAQATDKLGLASLAAAVGLETPPTVLLTAGEEAVDRVRFPVVVKPLRSEMRGPGGFVHSAAQFVDDADNLGRALATLPGKEGLVQPYLPGRLVTVNGVAWEGRMLCAVHQRADRLWPRRCGVFAYGVTTAPDRRLEQACAALLEQIGWSGLFNLQFLEWRGARFLVDLNPRIYHSLGLTVAAGPNLPAIWCDLLLGRAPPAGGGGYRIGVRFRAEEEDVRAIASTLWAHEWGRAAGAARPHRRTVHANFAVRDPAPTAATLLGKTGKALRATQRAAARMR